MALISISAPGDVIGAISAIAQTITSANNVLEALIKDTSPEGRTALAAVNTIFAPLVSLLNKLESHVPETSANPPTKTTN